MKKNLRYLGLFGALFLTSAVVQAQITYVDANATNTQAVGGTPSPFFTTFLSKDGQKWTEVGKRELEIPSKVHVGLPSLARPSIIPSQNRWQFDHLELIKGE